MWLAVQVSAIFGVSVAPGLMLRYSRWWEARRAVQVWCEQRPFPRIWPSQAPRVSVRSTEVVPEAAVILGRRAREVEICGLKAMGISVSEVISEATVETWVSQSRGPDVGKRAGQVEDNGSCCPP